MLRSHPRLGPVLVLAGDQLAMVAAWAISGRLGADRVSPVLLLCAAVVHLVVGASHDLHQQLRYVSSLEMLKRVLAAWIRVSLLLCVAGFFLPELATFHAVAAFSAALLLLLAAVRLGAWLLRRWVRQRGRNIRYIVVVGTGPAAVHAARSFTADAGYGIRLLGYLGRGPASGLDAEVIGRPDEIEELVRTRVIDEVVIAEPEASVGEVARLVETCSSIGLRTHLLANFLPGTWRSIETVHVGNDFMVTMTPFPHGVVSLTAKRLVDISLAAVAMVALLPVLLILAIAIKIDSPGPVFFVQWRIGLNGRRFRFPKFRSMNADAEAQLPALMAHNEMDGPVFKIERDPRITRLGAFLRRYSLDELPQLWCVLRGDMSLVGPRPLMPHEIDGHKTWQRRRLSMRPGLTCLWQVSGRNAIQFEEWMRLDMEYIDRWSLGLDLRILLRTLPAVLSGRGAS